MPQETAGLDVGVTTGAVDVGKSDEVDGTKELVSGVTDGESVDVGEGVMLALTSEVEVGISDEEASTELVGVSTIELVGVSMEELAGVSTIELVGVSMIELDVSTELLGVSMV